VLEEDPVMVGAAVAEVVAKGKGVLGLGLAAGFGQGIRSGWMWCSTACW